MIDPGREKGVEGIVTGLKNEVRAVNDDRAQEGSPPDMGGERERGESAATALATLIVRRESILSSPDQRGKRAMTGAQKKVGQDKHRTERASKQGRALGSSPPSHCRSFARIGVSPINVTVGVTRKYGVSLSSVEDQPVKYV